MIDLGSYFAPLNFYNTLILFIFVFCCEILGYKISSLVVKVIPNFLRGATWLMGLGSVVFLYFISHFFLPYNSFALLTILVAIFLFSIPIYVREKGYKSLVLFLKSNKIPLLITVIVLPKIVIKSSLPPYLWDEMAYHYVSPFTLNFEGSWQVLNSFYQNLPRLLETLYIALFSLTKTYAVARLVHFTIFVSFLLTMFTYLRQNFGYLTALVCFVSVLFYSENFLLWSTLGYIDVGTTSFVMISLLCFIDFIVAGNSKLIPLGLGFIGMAIGSKYSALTQLLSMALISIYFLLVKIKFNTIKRKYFISGMVLLLILGGYWYIKNIMFTGNPIYPFLLGCKFESCESVSLGYTHAFSLPNALYIYKTVFLSNKFFEVMFLISSILIVLFGNSKTRKILFLLLVFVLVEIICVKAISGYESRYFYHWQIIALFILSLPTSLLFKKS